MQLHAVDSSRRFLHGYWGVRQRMLRRVQPVMKDTHELEIGDFFLLDYIDRSGLSPTEIATAMSLPAPVVSRRLEGLERRDLISRRPDTLDARRRVLSLTPAGKECLEQAAITIDRLTRDFLNVLAPQQLEGFLSALETLAQDRSE